MTKEEWEIQRVKYQDEYLRVGYNAQKAMIYSRDRMYEQYGPQPARILTEEEKERAKNSKNIFQKIGSVVTAPFKMVNFVSTLIQVLGDLKGFTNGMFKLTPTSIVAALVAFFGSFGAAWSGSATHELGSILSAVVAGVVAALAAFKTTRPEIK
jgi:hypothetical protein